jgi:hypothetical protein
MKFPVPEEGSSKLPFWSEEELQKYAREYAEYYEVELDDLLKASGLYLGELDDVMDVVNTTKGVPTETWDLFYERWHGAYLIHLNAYKISHTEEPSAYIDQYFEENTEMLSNRPGG